MGRPTGFSSRSVELLLLLLIAGMAGQARAVPSYARQTGQECIACHVSFPELTPYGRYFKLTGYTIGKVAISSEGVNYVPMAVMAQASVTNTRNNNAIDPATGDTVSVNQRNNGFVLCCASLFLAGKVTDYLGVLFNGAMTTWPRRQMVRWVATAVPITWISALSASTAPPVLPSPI